MTFSSVNFVSLTILVLAETGYSRPLTDRELSDLQNFAETMQVWKLTIKGLERMKRMTDLESQKDGEALPEEAAKELQILLKVLYIFSSDMKSSYNNYLEEATSSEIPEKYRNLRKALVKTIEKIDTYIRDIATNLGLEQFSSSSIEKISVQLDKIWAKNLSLSVLLRKNNLTFETRFFEMIEKFIRNFGKDVEDH